MENKKILFPLLWSINVLLLAILILIPKTSNMYMICYFLTMFAIFVIPFFLIVSQCYYVVRVEKDEQILSVCAPGVGSIMIIMLTFLNFMGSIEKIAVAQMVAILLTFVFAEVMLTLVLILNKKLGIRQYLFTNAAIYIVLVVYFFCAMIMSVDYGVI